MASCCSEDEYNVTVLDQFGVRCHLDGLGGEHETEYCKSAIVCEINVNELTGALVTQQPVASC